AAHPVHLYLFHHVLTGRVRPSQLAVAVFALQPYVTEDLRELCLVGAASQRITETGSGRREKAGIENAIGREPGAAACAAERFRHRGYEADLTRAILVFVAARHFPG